MRFKSAMMSFIKIVLVFIVILAILNIYSRVFVENKINLNTDIINYSEIDNNASNTILFVGGLSGWSETWLRSINSLRAELALSGEDQNYNYIAIDLPPFGYSLPNLDNYYRDTQANIINNFINDKKLENITFVMHSYGAGPGIEAVMNDKSKFKKVIVIDGVLNIDERDKEITNNPFFNKTIVSNSLHIITLFDTIAKNRLESFVHIKDHIDMNLVNLYTKPFDLDGNSQKLAIWLIDYLNDPLKYKSNDSKNYKNIGLPINIIWGDQDSLTTPDLAHSLYNSLDNRNLNFKNNLYMLSGVGHIPMIESLELFDNTLLKAIKE